MSLSPSNSTRRPEHGPVVDVQHEPPPAPTRMILCGDLDGLIVEDLQASLSDVLRRYRPASVEMDAHLVTYLDSGGIRALLRCRAAAQRAGCDLTLVQVSKPVYQVLEITALLDHFGVVEQQSLRLRPRDHSLGLGTGIAGSGERTTRE
jgi:anti-anti-sigma factor